MYTRQDVALLRNLVTGAVQRLPAYLTPLAWSSNVRWLLFSGERGGDFTVRDVASGAESSYQNPLTASTSTIPAPPPGGPYYLAGVTDEGQVVRYERPDTPTPVGALELDVFDLSSRSARPIPVPLPSLSGCSETPRSPRVHRGGW